MDELTGAVDLSIYKLTIFAVFIVALSILASPNVPLPSTVTLTKVESVIVESSIVPTIFSTVELTNVTPNMDLKSRYMLFAVKFSI